MSKSLLTLIAAMLFSAGCAKIVVTPVVEPLSGGKMKKEGLFYALPKTVVRVQLKVDKTTKQDAPFSKFAAVFAPDGEKICAKPGDCKLFPGEDLPQKIEVKVQEGASFSTFGRPDPGNIYLVELSGGGVVDQALNLTWNEAGLLASASSTVKNRTTDIVMSGTKLVAGLGTKAGQGGGEDQSTLVPCPEYSGNDPWVQKILSKVLAPDFLVANYCAIDQKDRDLLSETIDSPLLQKATSIYRAQVEPYVISRTSLLRGEGSPALDPTPLINKLETLIDQKLKALFLGSITTVTWEGIFDLDGVTKKNITQPIALFEIVAEMGVAVDEKLLAPESKPVPPALLAAPAGGPKVAVELAYFPVQSDQLFDRVDRAVDEPKGERSFRYRLPAQVQASLRFDNKTLGRAVFSVAQLGRVVSLPARRNSRTLTYDLTMIEATGGLKGFKLDSTGAVDAATIDSLAAAGGTILDARNAARQEKETAEDELTKLTLQHARLKLEDDICTIQKKYGRDCTIQP